MEAVDSFNFLELVMLIVPNRTEEIIDISKSKIIFAFTDMLFIKFIFFPCFYFKIFLTWLHMNKAMNKHRVREDFIRDKESNHFLRMVVFSILN
jgi:hypothetical protein